MGVVIAKRDLLLGRERRVQVLIGKPEPFPDGIDWYCPYQITGIGSERVWWAGGVDSVQALVLALQNVGAWLVSSPEFKGGELRWECGSTDGDLGFPVSANIRDALAADQDGGGSKTKRDGG